LIAVVSIGAVYAFWSSHERTVAERADTMARRLTELGIPNTRANHYPASIRDRDQLPLLQRTSTVMSGEIPIVIVNGKGESNGG
jgi:hypothetical protein